MSNDEMKKIIRLFRLWKMNVIPSHVLLGALTMMKHANSKIDRSIGNFSFNKIRLDLTTLFISSALFPSFLDKNSVVPDELDPTIR